MENFDWKNLSFGYVKTDYNIRCYYRDGKWGELEIHTEEDITMSMAATCLHYGQEAFEGLKAFRGKDGDIRIFRPQENAKRMVSSAEYIEMAPLPEEKFVEAIKKVVKLNERFLPPYGTGASMYIRPVLIGTGARVGVHPADEYLFCVFVTPVGPYYKNGFKPIDVIVDRGHDRAAPHGTGHIKVGGNYAASLKSQSWAKKQGYSIVLYLDSAEKKYIDECGTSNFFAIKGNTYITPASHSILHSITNLSVMDIARGMGMEVECHKVAFSELDSFDECGACGTAAVVTPISKIVDPINGKEYIFSDSETPGRVTEKLYNRLRAIQLGEEEDKFNWIVTV
ncbi:MAG: branched-chain amino acid aminotransferase [Rikenellaceae bacterium]|nr:branched-chain amino acid aminotransferase [Rikenellaceae bacterium]